MKPQTLGSAVIAAVGVACGVIRYLDWQRRRAGL